MKNALSILSKVFRTTMDAIPLTKVVTLEFCYDNVNRDYPGFNLDELLLLPHGESQPFGIQETE